MLHSYIRRQGTAQKFRRNEAYQATVVGDDHDVIGWRVAGGQGLCIALAAQTVLRRAQVHVVHMLCPVQHIANRIVSESIRGVATRADPVGL